MNDSRSALLAVLLRARASTLLVLACSAVFVWQGTRGFQDLSPPFYRNAFAVWTGDPTGFFLSMFGHAGFLHFATNMIVMLLYGAKKVLGTDKEPAARDLLRERGGEPVASLDDLLARSDVVVTVTGVPGLLRGRRLRPGGVVLALSNPAPEIPPEEALAAGASFAADGASVNNALAYPGIFRGALAVAASRINGPMKVAAADAIAAAAEEGEIVPSALDLEVHLAVARRVAAAAIESGVARERVGDLERAIPPLRE